MHSRGVLIVGLLVVASSAVSAETFRVERPWARPSAPGVSNGAAYVTLVNEGDRPGRLAAVRSDVASRVELHGHVHDQGVLRMRQVPGLALAPGETIEFQPGGLHLMLIGLARPLVAGTRFMLTLEFESGHAVSVDVPVLQPGMRPPVSESSRLRESKGSM